MDERRRSRPHRRRQPRRTVDGRLPRSSWCALARRRAASRHRDPPSRRTRQPARDRGVPRGRAGGRDRGGGRPGVRPERGDRVRREPRREGARLVLPQHQRGRRGRQPVGAALRHADRARAGPAPGGEASGSTGRARVRGHLGGAGRRRGHGRRPPERRRARANGASPVPDRSRRCPQPDPRAARNPRPRPRQLLGQHHDLLQSRCPPADGGSQPQRGLRLRAPASGVLPLLDRPAGGVPRGELDGRRGGGAIGPHRRGHEPGDLHPLRPRGTRRSRHRGRDRGRTALVGVGGVRPAAAGRAACSSPETRPT